MPGIITPDGELVPRAQQKGHGEGTALVAILSMFRPHLLVNTTSSSCLLNKHCRDEEMKIYPSSKLLYKV